MERREIARAVRRRAVRNAIGDERERLRSLAAHLDELVAEADGPEIDRAVFAAMDADDVTLVREALGIDPIEIDRDELGFLADEDDSESLEDEIVRLQEELDLAERRIAALERYLAGLDAVEEARSGS